MLLALPACNPPEPESNSTITFKVGPSVSFEMVYVQGGYFDMGTTRDIDPLSEGNERPVHRVAVERFYVAKTEVTAALYRAVMGRGAGLSESDPATGLSYDDCQAFVDSLNRLASAAHMLPAGMVFSLPTEAQWEYVARGGNKSRGTCYAGSNNGDDVAWCDSVMIHNCGRKAANELGLYDMSGNAAEWCSDYYGPYTADEQVNPQGPETGTTRVLRGGSAAEPEADCRVTTRRFAKPDTRDPYTGMRLVLRSAGAQ